VTIHAAGGLTTGFVQNTGPLLIDGLDVGIPHDSPRLISSDADGAHFQNNRRGVTIQNSSFQGMADDAIAIYSLATTINQVIAPGPNGKVVDYSSRIIEAGDRCRFSMRRMAPSAAPAPSLRRRPSNARRGWSRWCATI
jgi:hypothetical protein